MSIAVLAGLSVLPIGMVFGLLVVARWPTHWAAPWSGSRLIAGSTCESLHP